MAAGEPKFEVPQIKRASEMYYAEELQISPETDISQDFWNVFVPVLMDLRLIEKLKKQSEDPTPIVEKLAGFQMKHYEALYPEEKYPNIVNDHNREAITQMDAMVEEFNAMQETSVLDADRALRIINTASSLIYGSEAKTYTL